MLALWTALMSFIGGPVIKGLVDAYNAKLKATNNSETIAANLAASEMVTQRTEIQAQQALKVAEIGHPFEPEKLAFYVWLIYFAKCVIWDNVLGLGTTPALYGAVATWCNLIVSFYFAKRGFENIARIIKR